MATEIKNGLPPVTIRVIYPAANEELNRDREYYLITQGKETPLDNREFHMIEMLGAASPRLIYTTDLIAGTLGQGADVQFASREQYVAERMHRLSQDDYLGGLLQPEVYGGVRIVGYKLAVAVKIERLVKSNGHLVSEPDAIADGPANL